MTTSSYLEEYTQFPCNIICRLPYGRATDIFVSFCLWVFALSHSRKQSSLVMVDVFCCCAWLEECHCEEHFRECKNNNNFVQIQGNVYLMDPSHKYRDKNPTSMMMRMIEWKRAARINRFNPLSAQICTNSPSIYPHLFRYMETQRAREMKEGKRGRREVDFCLRARDSFTFNRLGFRVQPNPEN